jgi:hypothetical protein
MFKQGAMLILIEGILYLFELRNDRALMPPEVE